jgi:hypothetical protein
LALTCCVSFAITISCSFTPRLLPTILSASLRASWNASRSWTACVSGLRRVGYLLGDCSGVCVGVDQIEQVEDVWTEVEFVVVV